MSKNHYDSNSAPISLSDIMLKVTLMLFVMYLVIAVIEKKKNEESNILKKAEFQITAEWNKARDPNVDCDVDL